MRSNLRMGERAPMGGAAPGTPFDESLPPVKPAYAGDAVPAGHGSETTFDDVAVALDGTTGPDGSSDPDEEEAVRRFDSLYPGGDTGVVGLIQRLGFLVFTEEGDVALTALEAARLGHIQPEAGEVHFYPALGAALAPLYKMLGLAMSSKTGITLVRALEIARGPNPIKDSVRREPEIQRVKEDEYATARLIAYCIEQSGGLLSGRSDGKASPREIPFEF
ncbi:MAG: hypothetical protein V1659_03190 [Candidatus Woesearchaeota archaeon]